MFFSFREESQLNYGLNGACINAPSGFGLGRKSDIMQQNEYVVITLLLQGKEVEGGHNEHTILIGPILPSIFLPF